MLATFDTLRFHSSPITRQLTRMPSEPTRKGIVIRKIKHHGNTERPQAGLDQQVFCLKQYILADPLRSRNTGMRFAFIIQFRWSQSQLIGKKIDRISPVYFFAYLLSLFDGWLMYQMFIMNRHQFRISIRIIRSPIQMQYLVIYGILFTLSSRKCQVQWFLR